MSRRTNDDGFTLVELLVVMAIIACLVSLLLPSLATVRQKADTIKCTSNMRQIGVAVNLYVSDHSERTPIIEPWPSQPVYSSTDGAQTMLQSLATYGVTSAALQCPSDLKGPNYYAKEGSSYQWFPGASNQNTHSVTNFFPRMTSQNQTLPMSKLMLAFDYSGVHNGQYNVLFGDGHVAAGD
jgi:prepilin-type N-terminal cleavage/methylation domain-containing protein/prepilin-type processing-associated H-X9-DG protein